jgi:UrcA family protein
MKYFTGSILLFALALSGSGVLLAAGIEDSRYSLIDKKSAVVRYSDLNLLNPADAKILLRRVEELASELCERQSDIRQLNAIRDQKRCIEESYKKALAAINRQAGVDTKAVAARTTGSAEIVVAE